MLAALVAAAVAIAAQTPSPSSSSSSPSPSPSPSPSSTIDAAIPELRVYVADAAARDAIAKRVDAAFPDAKLRARVREAIAANLAEKNAAGFPITQTEVERT